MPACAISVLFATTNRGKLAEMHALLGDLPIEVLSLAQVLPGAPAVLENGTTFEENALLKGRFALKGSLMVTIAEDSGLEVDALGGRPGVRSARFAREGATDAENNAALLQALEDVDDEQRTARFRCAVALFDPWVSDQAQVFVGTCEGRIAHQPRGTAGFGYDPLFIVQGHEKTMSELTPTEKNLVSHRGRAIAKLKEEFGRALSARVHESHRSDHQHSQPAIIDPIGGCG